MGRVLWFAVGFGAGVVLVARLRNVESSCCRRVSAGVREELVDQFGGVAGSVYDASGLGNVAPALLDLFGVEA